MIFNILDVANKYKLSSVKIPCLDEVFDFEFDESNLAMLAAISHWLAANV